MKKCPVCEKTFDDSMKFCQVDGTELVSDEPPFDPYATVVGHKLGLTPESDKPAETPVEEIADAPAKETDFAKKWAKDLPSEISVSETAEAFAGEPLIHETTGSVPIGAPDEVLELPGADLLKTMYVSKSELMEVFGTDEASETLTEESIMTEPPAAGFGDMAPPPSPFSAPESSFEPPPIDPSPYADAETVLAQNVIPPFKEPEPAQWTPPLGQDMQNQVVSNEPYQSQSAGVEAQDKVLALVSLICGILSCTVLCCMGIFLGPAAIVLGFMAKKKSDENPAEFGGGGLALAGMITGVLGTLLGIGVLIYAILR